jgi:NAD(P)H-dependent FMN reductase
MTSDIENELGVVVRLSRLRPRRPPHDHSGIDDRWTEDVAAQSWHQTERHRVGWCDELCDWSVGRAVGGQDVLIGRSELLVAQVDGVGEPYTEPRSAQWDRCFGDSALHHRLILRVVGMAARSSSIGSAFLTHQPQGAPVGRPKLAIIIASTRPGRVGPSIGTWFEGIATTQGDFDVEVVDLKKVDLPVFDEPNHPMLGDYVHEHTKRWAARIAAADAFVFVMPEYNHSYNAALKNAIDYLHGEWTHKPVGFVSYGGISAGTRAVQALKPVCTALRMHPVTEQVAIAAFQQYLTDDGEFAPAAGLDDSARAMLSSLAKWTQAMQSLRQSS